MKKRKGFTLIELLVVISIIVVLMAILIPSLNRARNSARAVVCQSRLKQWGTVFALYIDDNDGHFFQDIHAPWWLYCSFKYFKKLEHSIDDTGMKEPPDFAYCPMAVRINESPSDANMSWGIIGGVNNQSHGELSSHRGNGVARGSTFNAWSFWTRTKTGKVYKINNYAYSGSFGLSVSLVEGGIWVSDYNTWKGLDFYKMNRQANIPVLLDCAQPFNNFYSAQQGPAFTAEKEIGSCLNRHNEHVNSLFMDWSVRKVGLKELWKLKWNNYFDTNGPWTVSGGVKPEDWPEWMRGFKDY